MGKLCLCDFDFFGFPSKELESIPNEIEQQNTNKPINKPVYESVYLQVVWQHSTILILSGVSSEQLFTRGISYAILCSICMQMTGEFDFVCEFMCDLLSIVDSTADMKSRIKNRQKVKTA
jgi:hypothetical protein